MFRAIRLIGFVVLGLVALAATAAAQSYDVVKVADGVYAGVGRGEVGSNGTFIVNQDDVVVVDTQRRPAWARDLITEIKKVTNKPVRYVINTHYHLDHWLGNEAYVDAYGPGVTFIAQTNTRQDAIERGIPGAKDNIAKDIPDQIGKLQKMLADGKDDKGNPLTADSRKLVKQQLDSQKATLDVLKSARYVVPTVTYDKSLVLNDGDREIDLMYLGRGHTRGDTVVYLPKDKVVITGDLVNARIPVFRDGHAAEWVEVLNAITKLDWDFLIPGHGDVERGRGHILELTGYIRDLSAAAKDAVAKGMTADQAVQTIDLKKYGREFQPNFEAANEAAIRRAYDDASGNVKN
jgi:cyclase